MKVCACVSSERDSAFVHYIFNSSLAYAVKCLLFSDFLTPMVRSVLIYFKQIINQTLKYVAFDK